MHTPSGIFPQLVYPFKAGGESSPAPNGHGLRSPGALLASKGRLAPCRQAMNTVRATLPLKKAECEVRHSAAPAESEWKTAFFPRNAKRFNPKML